MRRSSLRTEEEFRNVLSALDELSR